MRGGTIQASQGGKQRKEEKRVEWDSCIVGDHNEREGLRSRLADDEYVADRMKGVADELPPKSTVLNAIRRVVPVSCPLEDGVSTGPVSKWTPTVRYRDGG